MAYFPLFVQLDGARCLVAGGGRVAYRKCCLLAEFGAQILAVAPEFCPKMQALAAEQPTVCLVRRRALADDAKGMALVVCATDDPGINREIADYCKHCRIPVNVADDKENSTVYFPGIVRQEDVVLGISTGGTSPAAVKYLRKYLERQMPPFMGRLVKTLGEFREEIKLSVTEQRQREQLFTELFYEGLARNGDLPREVLEKKLGQNEKEREQAE